MTYLTLRPVPHVGLVVAAQQGGGIEGLSADTTGEGAGPVLLVKSTQMEGQFLARFGRVVAAVLGTGVGTPVDATSVRRQQSAGAERFLGLARLAHQFGGLVHLLLLLSLSFPLLLMAFVPPLWHFTGLPVFPSVVFGWRCND